MELQFQSAVRYWRWHFASAPGARHANTGRIRNSWQSGLDAAVFKLRSAQHSKAAAASFRRHLYARGVQTETPYPILLGPRESLPNTWDLVKRLILVPCGASLTASALDQIVDAIKEAGSQVVRSFGLAPEGAASA